MSEDITKAKKKGRKPRERVHYHVYLNEPANGAEAAARGHVDALNQAKPDVDKSTGNPVDSGLAPHPGNRQATSRGIAAGHPDLVQHSANAIGELLAQVRRVRGSTVDHGFGEDDRTPGGYSNAAGTDRLYSADFAAQAGGFRELYDVDHTPGREADHTSRGSGTKPNGSHSLRDVESHAVANKSRLDIMREAMFGS